MCMYVVCTCTCMYCMYMNIIHVHTCMYIHPCIYMYLYMCVYCMYLYIYIYMYVVIICTCTCTCNCVYSIFILPFRVALWFLFTVTHTFTKKKLAFKNVFICLTKFTNTLHYMASKLTSAGLFLNRAGVCWLNFLFVACLSSVSKFIVCFQSGVWMCEIAWCKLSCYSNMLLYIFCTTSLNNP